jgi:adenosylcobinamide-GDP ribazoletransferase
MVAMQFLTTCPPFIRRLFEPAELGRAVGYFPLVGVLLGLALAGISAVLSLVFPAGVGAALLLVAWVLLTGSLHVDGFLDACDGLFGGFTAEERMRIMRDERVGGYALSGGVLLFIVKYAALAGLAGLAPALVLAPVLGRWAMSAGVVLFPYARSKGLGRDMKDQAHTRQFVLATMMAIAAALVVAWLSASYVPLLACAVAVLATAAVARFTMQRIPGLTGDIYGALCELVEVCVLLTFVAGAMR